jgi:hypothetical protein
MRPISNKLYPYLFQHNGGVGGGWMYRVKGQRNCAKRERVCVCVCAWGGGGGGGGGRPPPPIAHMQASKPIRTTVLCDQSNRILEQTGNTCMICING